MKPNGHLYSIIAIQREIDTANSINLRCNRKKQEPRKRIWKGRSFTTLKTMYATKIRPWMKICTNSTVNTTLSTTEATNVLVLLEISED